MGSKSRKHHTLHCTKKIGNVSGFIELFFKGAKRLLGMGQHPNQLSGDTQIFKVFGRLLTAVLNDEKKLKLSISSESMLAEYSQA